MAATPDTRFVWAWENSSKFGYNDGSGPRETFTVPRSPTPRKERSFTMPSKTTVFRNCLTCGKEFKVYPCWLKRGDNVRYCSRACRPSGTIQHSCIKCSRVFLVRNYESRTGKGKYCSRICKKLALASVMTMRHCATCGVKFFIPISDVKHGNGIYCSAHCRSARPRLPLAERFWGKVKKDKKCWIWTAAKNENGYGICGRTIGSHLAHRIAWELINGPIPDGLFVLHHCDNPPCVRADKNPLISHLFLGTQADNAADMCSKKRYKRPGAKLTSDQVKELYSLRDVLGLKALAQKFGISKSMAWLITTRKQWKGVLTDNQEEFYCSK